MPGAKLYMVLLFLRRIGGWHAKDSHNILLVALAPKLQSQQPQARSWHCVRQPFAETTGGDAVQCIAALPQDEKLDAEAEETLSKLHIIRHTAMTFKRFERESPGNSSLDAVKEEKNWMPY